MATSHLEATGILRLEDFARAFGITTEEVPQGCRRIITEKDFRYREVSPAERDQILLDELKRTDSGELVPAGTPNRATWELAWDEKLQSLKQGDPNPNSLIPSYIGHGRDHPILRLNQTYVVPVDPDFQLNWYRIMQCWLFETYLAPATTVYEFGCGSGINLAAMAGLYPEKRYVGLDWSPASQEIVDTMANKFGWNMEGRFFDFFAPEEDFALDEGGVVLTVDALEQAGSNFEPFLQYLLQASPALCINVEPILEWYESDNLVDYSAIRYHKQRKYLEGFPGRLESLEQAGKIEILKTQRCYFGTLFVEGYSHIIWRPLAAA